MSNCPPRPNSPRCPARRHCGGRWSSWPRTGRCRSAIPTCRPRCCPEGWQGRRAHSLANFGLAPQGGAADSAVWWNNFQAWLTDYDVDWCWRALNPTQPQGTIPVTNRHRSDWGDPEPWGLLAPDWRGVANPRVLDLLKSMMPPRTGPGII